MGCCTIILLVGCAIGGLLIKNYLYEILNPTFEETTIYTDDECLEFVHKLDSVSGIKFYIQSYQEWLYVAHLGGRNANTSYYDDCWSCPRLSSSEAWRQHCGCVVQC